jgi:hypothetical protein
MRKKNNYLLELYRRNYSADITSYVIVVYIVIFFNSLEYTNGLRLSVFPSVNHRRTNFVGDNGICNKVFSIL